MESTETSAFEYSKADIQKLLNKNNSIDSNKLKKTNLTPQQAYNIYYDIEFIPICDGCHKELRFQSFISGYGTCGDRKCPLEKQKCLAKKAETRSKQLTREYICDCCGKTKSAKFNTSVCPSCVKIIKKEKILSLEPSTRYECVRAIQHLLDTNVSPDHWNEVLQSSFRNEYVFLYNNMQNKNLTSISESAYQLYYDTESAVCKGCGEKVNFKSFNRGYNQFCPNIECQWKDEEQKDLKIKNIARTFNTKRIQENIGKSSYYNPIYKNMEKVNKTFSLAKYIDDFDELEDFDKNVEFLDFLEPDDIRQRYYYYKNNIFEEKKCLHCGTPLSHAFKDFCSNSCIAFYTKEDRIEANLRSRGVEYPTQCKEVIKKREQQTMEKYGVSHHMHLQEYKDKCMNTKIEKYGSNFALMSYNTKTYITPSGKEVIHQGYEHFLLKEMYSLYDEDDVINDAGSVVYYDKDCNKHRYFPDLYIKSIDTLYEVKSEYTLKQSLLDSILYYKLQSAVNSVSRVVLVVYSSKGELEFEISFTEDDFEENFKIVTQKY